MLPQSVVGEAHLLRSASTRKLLYFKAFFSLFATVMTVFVLIYPAFEWPDERKNFHDSILVEKPGSTIYYPAVKATIGLLERTGLTGSVTTACIFKKDHINYGKFESGYIWGCGSEFGYRLLKLANAWIAIGAISFAMYLLCRWQALGEVSYLAIIAALLTPSFPFYITQISSDFLPILCCPFVFLLRRWYWRFLAAFVMVGLVAGLGEDRNFLYIAMFFLLMPFAELFVRRSPSNPVFRAGLLLLALGLAFGIAWVMLYLGGKASIGGSIISTALAGLSALHKYTLSIGSGYNLPRDVFVTLLSMYYVGGSMSYLATPFEYAIFLFAVCWSLYRCARIRDVDSDYVLAAFCSAAFAFNFILYLIPTLYQGRYFLFLMPFIFLLPLKLLHEKGRLEPVSVLVCMAGLACLGTMHAILAVFWRGFLTGV